MQITYEVYNFLFIGYRYPAIFALIFFRTYNQIIFKTKQKNNPHQMHSLWWPYSKLIILILYYETDD